MTTDQPIQYGPPPLRPGYRWETLEEEAAREAALAAAINTQPDSADIFVLTIALGNDAMDDACAVAAALRKVADHLDTHGYQNDVIGRVRDDNGNTVGRWEVV